MRPFFTDTMLVTLTFEEATKLRAAVAHYRDLYDEKNESGELLFPDMYEPYNELYTDLTKIVEMMPF